MTEVSASLVKQLRDKTDVGMMDCKKALVACDGDFDKAVDWLRTKGISNASKKSGRVTAEGLIAALVKANEGILLELNSETDFVSRNDKFQNLSRNLAEKALSCYTDIESFKQTKLDNGKTVAEEISEHIAVIGENINVRRLVKLSVESGIVGNYIHNSVADGLGKIGVLVAIESDIDSSKIEQIAKHIAMHIAASRPEALTIEDVDQAKVEKEKLIFSEQASSSGKPKEVVEKMVEGRIRKYYDEIVLLEQPFIIDNKIKISKLIEDTAAKLGGKIRIKQFVRYSLGEGVNKD